MTSVQPEWPIAAGGRAESSTTSNGGMSTSSVIPHSSLEGGRVTALASAHPLVGVSPAIVGIREIVDRVARSGIAVHVQGPTGTGKELVARSLHAQSGVSGRFVAVNVCAISDGMFEDALFGHVRGAFTGATSDSVGYMREANAGTLFLDEISGLPLGSQAKLLRAIESGEFRPVGASRDSRSNFRVVSASNEDLSALVRANRFRLDLLHRLQAAVIRIPSLDSRPEDILPLIRHFLSRLSTVERWSYSITPSAASRLIARSWPGNVRELRQVLECAAALSTDGLITDTTIRDTLSMRSEAGHWSGDATELQALRDAMRQANEHVATAAEILGVHRSTVYRRLRAAGL